MICKDCKRPIEKGDQCHHSLQSGMRGYYHWECFLNQCRQTNLVGAREIDRVKASIGGSVDNAITYPI